MIRDSDKQKGLAMVEFVIVLPLLLILLMSIGEFGRGFYHYSTLSKTVRDGARYASAYAIPDDTGQIQITDSLLVTTRNLVVYGLPVAGEPLLPGLSADSVSLTQVDTNHINVTVTYSYEPIFAVLPMFGLGPDVDPAGTMTASVTMRAL